MNFPVFDLHCDTALALLGESFLECGSLRHNKYHIDLERAKSLGGYAQCFACFTDGSHPTVKPVEQFERQMVTVLREIEKNNDLIRLAYSADDIAANSGAGVMSAVLTVEDPCGFGYDPQLLQDLYSVGFRMTTLGWNTDNPLTGSHLTEGGLTDLGYEFFKEAQRLGFVIDVSHISDEAFWNIMECTQAPIVASHSNSRYVCDSSRNLTDEMFLAICRSGGSAGINLFADFTGENRDIDSICDHIFHFLELDPEGKHISLGGDLDGCAPLVTGFTGVESYPLLAERLLERGTGQAIVGNIFWNNAIGVIKHCCT